LAKNPVIAIDLTPVLPGGDNGGAKVFALELIRGLSLSAPQIQFVLLTQAASHDELSCMDSKNVQRKLVIGSQDSAGSPARAHTAYRNLTGYLPSLVRRQFARVAYDTNRLLKRSASRSVLRQIGADLLFCPFTAPTYYEAGIPTVCTVYDVQFATYPQFFEADDLAHRRSTFLDACRKATTLVAISTFSRNSAITCGCLPPEKIRTILLRMAMRVQSSPKNERHSLLDRFGLEPQKYLLYPANFWRHKNHEMLLTAFGISCADGLPPDVKLVLTGSPGTRQDFVHAAVKALGLKGRVVFPGYVSNAELAALLVGARGMIFPSLYEGFGLPLLEAMAAEVPVGCGNIASMPEVTGDAAILFDPKKPFDIANAIVKLVLDEDMRQHLIEKGRTRAAQFSDTNRMVDEYWKVFCDATGRQLTSRMA
jgi:glycosyltransferase involved in cell wall biosynthesis